MFFAYIKADFIKARGLKICLAHLLIPLLAAAVFLLYYSVAPGNIYSKADAYFQVVGMAMPFLIGLFCGIISEQELMAGYFQNMLSAPVRIVPFYSKLFMLLLLGIQAAMLASVLFGAGYLYIEEDYIIDFRLYITAAFVIAGSSIFLYIMHLFLAMRFNKGVTTGLGIAESLLAAIMLTGLGDGVWMYIPASWPARFVTLLLPKPATYATMAVYYNQGLYTAIITCIIATLVLAAAFGIWAYKWDGTKSSE